MVFHLPEIKKEFTIKFCNYIYGINLINLAEETDVPSFFQNLEDVLNE